uniref:RIKEN cDNA 1700018B08 gene n=1 Tax=Jaculus jaculus TaxID=51337 RepID=A0A8C5P5P2_JACJA
RARFKHLRKKCASHKYPGSCTILQENVFCECCTRFGGCLPVPKAKALLPYWVPLSMRPQNQTSKVVLLYVPKANMTCPCLCHCFGGRLPMPRDQAVMPYWVPQGLRPQKVVKRRESANECPLDLSCWCGHWRVFGAQCFFLKRQQLQAFHEDKTQALGRASTRLGPLLPFRFGVLALLQAIMRAVITICQLFWD